MKGYKLALQAAGVFTAVVAGVVGCGTSSNNDQGVALTFLGYYADSGSTAPISSFQIPIGEATGETQLSGSSTDTATGTVPSTSYQAFVGVQNNLSSQAVRVDRLLLQYTVPGADAQPPTTTVPLGLVLGSSVSTSSTGGTSGTASQGSVAAGFGSSNSSLPPGLNGGGNVPSANVVSATLLPASIRAWLSLNRASLPEPPFHMEITGVVSGVTTAGDRLETNSQTILAEIVPETVVEPTEGSTTGTDGSTGTDTGAFTDGSSDTTSADDTGVTDLGGIFPTPADSSSDSSSAGL